MSCADVHLCKAAECRRHHVRSGVYHVTYFIKRQEIADAVFLSFLTFYNYSGAGKVKFLEKILLL